MPITGTFYHTSEIQDLLKISKHRVRNLARLYSWHSPHPGLYRGGNASDPSDVDAYLAARARSELLGCKRLVWDDSNDTTCPVCGGFAVEVGGGWRCTNGHSGE